MALFPCGRNKRFQLVASVLREGDGHLLSNIGLHGESTISGIIREGTQP